MASGESTSLLKEHNEDLPVSEPHLKIRQIHEQIKKRREEKDETLNEKEFDRYMQEELDQKLPHHYLKALQQNLLYYAFILIFIGLPVWIGTTSPYRAALQAIDPSIDDIRVPINLTFAYETQVPVLSIEAVVRDLTDDNPELLIKAKIVKLKGNLKDNPIDLNALNVVLVTQETFTRSFPNALIKTRGYFEGENRLIVNFVDSDSLFALLSRVLGTERLKSISNLGLQQNLSAWDRIPISTLYHLHLVFLHDNGIQDAQLQTKILSEAKKISKFVSKYGVLVDVSSVHLWDFDVESFTTTARSTERRLLLQDVETLTTEVDKYVNWIGVGIAQPLIKMAILVSDKQIKLLDTNSKPSNGFAVASWGGISALHLDNPKSTAPVLHSILDTLKTQLSVHSIEPEWNVEFKRSDPAHEFEWQRFVMQTFREHVQIASASLKGIHALKQKIENLVISKEVAVDVYESHEILMATLLQARAHSKIDMHGAIRARILAERAVKHSSTLQHLNFPVEQRYAIYVPLFLPVFVHILIATWHMTRILPTAIRRYFSRAEAGQTNVYFPYLFAQRENRVSH